MIYHGYLLNMVLLSSALSFFFLLFFFPRCLSDHNVSTYLFAGPSSVCVKCPVRWQILKDIGFLKKSVNELAFSPFLPSLCAHLTSLLFSFLRKSDINPSCSLAPNFIFLAMTEREGFVFDGATSYVLFRKRFSIVLFYFISRKNRIC